MKSLTIVIIGIIVMAGVMSLERRQWITDAQVAAGEWKIEVQTPPCADVHNLQVIWPKESGDPLTIECDLMPTPER